MAIVLDGTDSIGDLGDALNAKLNLAGGKVLQVVRANDPNTRTTTSTSFVDANISVTITPKATTSAILLIWSFYAEAPNSLTMVFQITDSANTAINGAQASQFGTNNANLQRNQINAIGWATPATISAVTYKGRFRVATSGTATIYNELTTGQLYAIEVSA